MRFALLLQDSHGRSLDQIEAWITATSHALLLRPAGKRRGTRSPRSEPTE